MAEGQEAYLLHTSTNSAAPSGIPHLIGRQRDATVVLTAVTSRSR
jgi:hypothetical protein